MINKPDNKIDPRLKAMLDELNNVPARDPRLATKGRARFLSQAVATRNQAVSYMPILRLREWLDKTKLKEFKMTTLVSIIAILGLLMGGTAGTVYASQDSLPNDALYGVKIASENVRLNFTGDTEAELDLVLEFVQNRSDEIDALVAEEGVIPEATMTRLHNHLEYALKIAGELDGEVKTKAVNRVRNMMQVQVQHLTNLEENAPEEAAQPLTRTRTTMENQLRLIEEGETGDGIGHQQQEGLQQGQEGEQGQGPEEEQQQDQGDSSSSEKPPASEPKNDQPSDPGTSSDNKPAKTPGSGN